MREIIGAVRQAVPVAANAPPGAVLEHVLTVLRAANAKVLDSFRERLIYAQSAARAVHKRATIPRWTACGVSPQQTFAARGAYDILKQMPERDGELRYRIRSAVEEHERIAVEGELGTL